MSDVTSTKNR